MVPEAVLEVFRLDPGCLIDHLSGRGLAGDREPRDSRGTRRRGDNSARSALSERFDALVTASVDVKLAWRAVV